MKGRNQHEEVDIDAILLREVAARRSPSGSVLDQPPASVSLVEAEPLSPAALLDQEPLISVPQGTSSLRRVRRRETLSPYEELFLRGDVVRQRSVIYISEQTKQSLTDVVQSLGGGRISVTTFAERILAHHLELFREQINRLHRLRNNKDIL